MGSATDDRDLEKTGLMSECMADRGRSSGSSLMLSKDCVEWRWLKKFLMDLVGETYPKDSLLLLYGLMLDALSRALWGDSGSLAGNGLCGSFLGSPAGLIA